ncbi:MAG: hypothetical protein ACKOJF_16755, partial [Planctomycetaceae bacterium]
QDPGQEAESVTTTRQPVGSLVLARSKTCGVRPPPLRGDWLYAVRMHYGTVPEGTVRKEFSGRDHPEGIDLGLLARFPC